MKNEVKIDEKCPICHNHCKLTNLKCKKGKAFAEKIGENHTLENKVDDIESKPMEAESRLVHMFHKCTHMLHHRKGHHHGQSRVLAILLKKGAMTQRELLDHAEVRSSSMSELLGKIEADGYITREKCDDDKRNVNVSLTESGLTAAKKQEEKRKQSSKELFSALDGEEKKQLDSILTKLIDSWKKDSNMEGHEKGHGEGCHHRHSHHHCGGRHGEHHHGKRKE